MIEQNQDQAQTQAPPESKTVWQVMDEIGLEVDCVTDPNADLKAWARYILANVERVKAALAREGNG